MLKNSNIGFRNFKRFFFKQFNFNFLNIFNKEANKNSAFLLCFAETKEKN